MKKESDPPENAIVYFYPPSVMIKNSIWAKNRSDRESL